MNMITPELYDMKSNSSFSKQPDIFNTELGEK